jgi:hypothetical protein
MLFFIRLNIFLNFNLNKKEDDPMATTFTFAEALAHVHRGRPLRTRAKKIFGICEYGSNINLALCHKIATFWLDLCGFLE